MADDPRTDDQLVAASLAGDEAAFAALVARHGAYLHGVAVNILGAGHDDIEDAVQQAWLHAYRHLAGYDAHGRFRGWLATICHHLCISHARRRRFVTTVLDALPDRPDALPGPDDLALRRELGEAIAAALAAIPREQAGAVLLCDRDGLTCAAAGALLGASANTIKTRVFRGRKRLRKALGGAG